MKIRHQKDVAPIHMQPGDRLELHYQEHDHKGRLVSDRTLHGEPVGREIIVNRIAVIDLDDGELKPLGMNDAIAGVFGERIKDES